LQHDVVFFTFEDVDHKINLRPWIAKRSDGREREARSIANSDVHPCVGEGLSLETLAKDMK
jgi:hypothetical protein